MSLVCHECGTDVQPGMVFPGREGGMLNASLLASVWDEDGHFTDVAFVESPNRSALCFECLLGMSPDEAYHNRLRRVFAAYNAEVAMNRFHNRMEGTWNGHDAMEELESLCAAYKKVNGGIPLHECLCCTKLLPDGQTPYFTFYVMDRAAGEDKTSFFGSYQWSHIQTGGTGFRLCFDCAKVHLPRSFVGHSKMLHGQKPNIPPNVEGVGKLTVLEELTPDQEELIRRHLER